tara:strand:- start:1807 stop:2133 length:327 start_codon:yes stop_codon:yes gene_type:complete
MTATPSAWRLYDQGHYVEMDIGATEIFAIDIFNELDTGDQLITVTATADAGITVLSAVPRTETTVSSTPNQMLVALRATQTGVFHIKLMGVTQNGATHVKHFDVLIER